METVLSTSDQLKKNGRPSLKDKPLGRADNTRVARKLGNVVDEALDLIIAAMRDSNESLKERVSTAKWIVNTMAASLKEVDRQAMAKYTIERLKKEHGTKEIADAMEQDAMDDDDTNGAVFSLSIVK